MNNHHRLFRHCEGAKRPKQSQYIYFIIIIAIIIKLSLFAFAAIHAPQGKILPDSPTYLRLADTLASRGAFAEQSESGALVFETFRTPGYPAFLAIFHGLMKIPLDGIILIQIAMTLLTAFVVYKTALEIEPKIAFLSAVIILLDPPITIFSLTILTESLFLLLISLFMYFFTLYLKATRGGRAHLSVPYRHLILSAIALALAAYVRPVAYYLGFVLPFFIIYANGRKNVWKGLKHALIFITVAYSIIGLWQVRNYIVCNNFAFCGSDQYNLSSVGLFKSYARNTDPATQGMAPLPYYISVSFRSFMSLMTRPGNFKYFGYEPLNLGSFVFSYPWMVFWLLGLVWGIIRVMRNTVVAYTQEAHGRAGFNLPYLQFMLFVTFFFIATSVVGQMWGVGPRFRVPMMPFIAIISAYGWMRLFFSKGKRICYCLVGIFRNN